MKIILLYLATLPAFFALDMLWLGVIAKTTYAKYLGAFMREPINWPVAVVFYLIFVIGILYFAVIPASIKGSWSTALINGAVFGFFTYMTYELTNWAILKDWPWQIVPIDIIWGTVLGGLVALASFYISRLIGY